MRSTIYALGAVVALVLASCGGGDEQDVATDQTVAIEDQDSAGDELSEDDSSTDRDNNEILTPTELCGGGGAEFAGQNVTVEGEIDVVADTIVPIGGRSFVDLVEVGDGKASVFILHGDGPNQIANPSGDPVNREDVLAGDSFDINELEITTNDGGTVGIGDIVQMTGTVQPATNELPICGLRLDETNADHIIVAASG